MRYLGDTSESLQRRGTNDETRVDTSDRTAVGMRSARREDLCILLYYFGWGNDCAGADFGERGGDDGGTGVRKEEFIGCEENAR